MKLSQVVIVMGLMGLAGCSSGERDMRLHYLKTNSGTPEEFAIVPNKPLETPPAMTALPAPTPGSANRTDQTPKADAVAALGGNPARLNERGTPSLRHRSQHPDRACRRRFRASKARVSLQLQDRAAGRVLRCLPRAVAEQL